MELKAIKDLALAFLYLPVSENKQIPLLVDHPYLDSAVTCVGDSMENILENEEALEVTLQRYENAIKDGSKNLGNQSCQSSRNFKKQRK